MGGMVPFASRRPARVPLVTALIIFVNAGFSYGKKWPPGVGCSVRCGREAIVLERGPEVRWRGLAAGSEERWGVARASSEATRIRDSGFGRASLPEVHKSVLPVQMLNSIHGSGPAHRPELP
jgi:hypothetical protein